MQRVRANDNVYARGVIMPIAPDEAGRAASPQTFALHLETDGVYRWYEGGSPTEVSGESLRTAYEAARLRWTGFQIIELEARSVTTNTLSEIQERHGSEDLADGDSP